MARRLGRVVLTDPRRGARTHDHSFVDPDHTADPSGSYARRMSDQNELLGVIDGHNDLPWATREQTEYSVEGLSGVPAPSGFPTDFERMSQGRVAGQFWSVYAEDSEDFDAVQYTLEQIDFVHRLVRRYPDRLAFARTAADVWAAHESGRVASLIGAEGGHSINGSLATLRMFARLGVRYMTLTHNRNTPWADSATDAPTHGGLTAFGRDVVRQMNDVGMLVDLSHVAPSTMADALDTSTSPVIFSHSSCRALSDHQRNVPDDILARLATNGGVIMVSFVPVFLSVEYAEWLSADRTGPKPRVTIADVVRHLNHARDVAGIDHVGIGSDYDGFDDFPDGLTDVSGFAALREALSDANWSAGEIVKLFNRNILRVLSETDPQFSAASK